MPMPGATTRSGRITNVSAVARRNAYRRLSASDFEPGSAVKLADEV
jgi:hypothetical protein